MALAVLLGRPQGQVPARIPQCAIKQLLVDLGWQSLWLSTASSAVTLYWSIKRDLPDLPHTQAANRDDPVTGSWVHAVLRLVTRQNIPPWQPAPGVSPSTVVWKRTLRAYRRSVVVPALRTARKGGLAAPCHGVGSQRKASAHSHGAVLTRGCRFSYSIHWTSPAEVKRCGTHARCAAAAS